MPSVNSQLLRWRTVAIVMASLLVLLVAYLVGLRHPAAGGLFDPMATAVCTIAGIGAAKSAVEHLGNGGGLRGAAAALLTDAKPGGPPQAQP